MSVELFLSDSEDAALEAMLQRLKKQNGEASISRHLVIVPDRFTLSMEAYILQSLGLSGSANIEAISFSRLAKKMTDGLKIMTPEAGVMLMRKILNENIDKLSSLKIAAKSSSFAKDMYAVIADLRNNCITVEDLKRASESLYTDKTKDIALIYAEYVKLISSGYSDTGGLLEKLVDAIKTDDSILGSDVYVAIFSDFTKLQLDILEQIAVRAKSLSIALAYKSMGANRRIFPIEAAEKVEKRMARAGVRLEKKFFKGELPAHKRALCDNLFGYTGRKFLEQNNWFASYYAASREEEASFVAREIKRLVVEEGVRYKDIAVVIGVPAPYESVVKKEFKTYGIPYFFDVKTPLSATPPANIVLLALRVLNKSFRAKEVYAFLKNELLGIDKNKLFDFENYALKYNVDYSRFCSPLEIFDANYDAAALEEVRSYIDLVEVFSNRITVSDYCDAIENFYDEIGCDQAIEKLCAFQQANGFEAQADALSQSPLKIKAVLRDLRAVLGDSAVDCGTFSEYFASACESVQIASVPLFLDSVYVGEVESGRYGNIKHMFIMGANEGSFPVEESGEGIIGLRETRALAKLDVIIEPDAKKRSLIKKYSVLNLMLKPIDRLVISAPLTADGGKAHPSFVLEQTEKLFSTERKHISTLLACDDDTTHFSRLICTDEGARVLLAKWLSESKESGVADIDSESKADLLCHLSGDTKLWEQEAMPVCVEQLPDAVWRKENDKQYTSVSQLEKYFRCPYFHFIESGLKLKLRELPDIKATDLGSFVHEVLELYFAENKDFSLSREQFEKLAKKTFKRVLAKDDYRFLKENAKNNAILAVQEAEIIHTVCELSMAMKHTKLLPYMQEAKFGRGGAFEEITLKLKDKTIYMTGKIDRIDKADDYVAVVDYKSKKGANIKFKIAEIYRGERVQLFTYLGAILQNGLKPAGVFYLPVAGSFEADEKDAKYKYRGFVCDDEDLIKYLDDTLTEGGKSLLYPVRLSKGQLKGDKMSRKVMQNVIEYVKKLEETAAEEIEEGYIEPSPVSENTCKYCDYSKVCQKNKYLDIVRKFKKVTAEDFGGCEDGD